MKPMKAIRTRDLDGWLAWLARQATVYCPQELPGGDVALAPLGQGPRVSLYRRLAQSPKRLLMPQIDDLVDFEDGLGHARLDEQERILFGLRPCDAAAIEILDRFFARVYGDPHYLARRTRMRLIVAACAESEDTCFCVSTRTGPAADGGFDVQLFDLGDVQLAQAGTPAGEEMLSCPLFGDPPPDAEHRLEELCAAARDNQKLHLDVQRAQEMVRAHREDAKFWQHVADQCLMCGGCVFVCPTCACFNVVDVVDPAAAAGSGVRQRHWDGCQLEGFTREASGHNPRGQQGSRCGHRYLHKLGGSDLENRAVRCVGCGRCADACITRMGMVRIVQGLLDEEKK